MLNTQYKYNINLDYCSDQHNVNQNFKDYINDILIDLKTLESKIILLESENFNIKKELENYDFYSYFLIHNSKFITYIQFKSYISYMEEVERIFLSSNNQIVINRYNINLQLNRVFIIQKLLDYTVNMYNIPKKLKRKIFIEYLDYKF